MRDHSFVRQCLSRNQFPSTVNDSSPTDEILLIRGGQLIQLRGVASDPDALRNCRALECHIISKLYNMSLNSFAVSKFDGELLASYAIFFSHFPLSYKLSDSLKCLKC